MDPLETIRQLKCAMASGYKEEDTHALQRALDDLNGRVQDTPPAAKVLKMMQSIGAYLSSKKERAHPESIPVLLGLCDGFERLLSPENQTGKAVQDILAQALKTFKDLKAQIASPPSMGKEDIQDLKAAVLSVDWEISDTTLARFDQVILQLSKKFESSRLHASFLKIMGSMGTYIAKNKAQSHPDSVTLLRSVFQDYEDMVSRPDMAPAQKKQLLEKNIGAFQAFKNQILQPGRGPAPSTQADEDMAPALSHLKGTTSKNQDAPLNTLSDQDMTEPPPPLGHDPAEADSQEASTVMDDLFSAKESPADELLEAIHLSELHGNGPAGGPGFPAQESSRSLEDGVQNFTPRRRDNDPIPEIESRLDEFFNLEPPAADPDESDPAPALSGIADRAFDREDIKAESSLNVLEETDAVSPGGSGEETDPEAVVPFQFEDEVYEDESGGDKADQDEPDPGEPDQGEPYEEASYGDESYEENQDEAIDSKLVFQKIKTCINDPESLSSPSVLDAFETDVQRFKGYRENDPEMGALLDMLTRLARSVHHLNADRMASQFSDQDATGDKAKKPSRPSGFWAKIGAIFRR